MSMIPVPERPGQHPNLFVSSDPLPAEATMPLVALPIAPGQSCVICPPGWWPVMDRFGGMTAQREEAGSEREEQSHVGT